jgi:hypothetical protein
MQWPHVSTPATLCRLLAMLRRSGATSGKPIAPRNPAQQLTDDYCRFLVIERLLSASTAKGWLPFIDKFLSEPFCGDILKLSELRATDVSAFVQRHAHLHSPSQARTLDKPYGRSAAENGGFEGLGRGQFSELLDHT